MSLFGEYEKEQITDSIQVYAKQHEDMPTEDLIESIMEAVSFGLRFALVWDRK